MSGVQIGEDLNIDEIRDKLDVNFSYTVECRKKIDFS